MPRNQHIVHVQRSQSLKEHASPRVPPAGLSGDAFSGPYTNRGEREVTTALFGCSVPTAETAKNTVLGLSNHGPAVTFLPPSLATGVSVPRPGLYLLQVCWRSFTINTITVHSDLLKGTHCYTVDCRRMRQPPWRVVQTRKTSRT